MKKHIFITIVLFSLTMLSVAQKYFGIYQYNKNPRYILTTFVDSIGFWKLPYTEDLIFYWNDKGNVNKYFILNVDSIKITNNISPLKPVLLCPDSNHPHMIDLGLPSGTLWSCCNVDASNPEDYGGYYAWGETHTKSCYTLDNYAYDIDRYNHYGIAGRSWFIKGSMYDAATANWGSPWHMPQARHFFELGEYCTSVWTTRNGVKGVKFTSGNGGSIFLPAAGLSYEERDRGYYWTSELALPSPSESPKDNEYAVFYELDEGSYATGGHGVWRYQGLSVRPVVDVSIWKYLTNYSQ